MRLGGLSVSTTSTSLADAHCVNAPYIFLDRFLIEDSSVSNEEVGLQARGANPALLET